MLGPVQWLTVHPDDREKHGAAHVASFTETMATGQPVWTCQEMRLRTRDGRWIWFQNRFCHSGARWLAVLRDLSEHKRIETSLRDFLTTTSHDARTPLSSIHAAAQLLRERLLHDDAPELLTAIIASARVLYIVVNNVMLTKHLDAGTCNIGCAPVALEPWISDVLATAQAGLALQAGTTVTWERTPLPEVVLSSEEHLSSLCLNLLMFCIQASDGSPVHIRGRFGPLRRRDHAGPSNQLEIEVAVHGPARGQLPAEELAKLFDPLAHSEPFADWLHSGGGSGRLGLHVSRRLAEALGGKLELLRDPVECIRLRASIPVALPPDAAPPEEVLSSEDSELETPAQQQPEVETGLLPFLPPGLQPSESFAEINRRGSVASVVDLLLTNSPEAFVVADQDAFSYVSPGLLTLLRYACREDLPPHITALIHADDLAQVLEAWNAARAHSTVDSPTPTSVTFRCLRGDHTYIWAQLSGCLTPTHLYAVLRDVSDRKALEQSLRGFLSSVMGDLRRPLASVQAASELLSARPCVRDDEETRFLVDAIHCACQMLSGIVSNVLNASGECRAENAPFSVRRMITDVLSVCRMSTAHRTDVNLLWPDEAAAQLPPLVLGDERLLSQCLLNLCTNAIKFCDGSNVVISACCENGELTLTVSDGGRGLSAEDCARVFEPYFCSPSSRGGGTGLGLYICRRFCDAMGGTISVESTPGAGARFSIRVPAVEVEVPDPLPIQPAPPPAQLNAPSSPPVSPSHGRRAPGAPRRDLIPQRDGRRLHVLLVDDHSLNRKLCGKLLELQGGLTVSTADDGDVAVRKLTESYAPGGQPFDFVLMDLAMPRCDGLQATRMFREWEAANLTPGHHLIILALSANVFEDMDQDCADVGFDGACAAQHRLCVRHPPIDCLRALDEALQPSGFLEKPLRLDALLVALQAVKLA